MTMATQQQTDQMNIAIFHIVNETTVQNRIVYDLPSELIDIMNRATQVTVTQSTAVVDRTAVTCLTVLYEAPRIDNPAYGED